ncbi:MAG: methyltransferase domain-containing protein, partial [Planctomycetes bacterium]|nr:methyltransferase domain-containing protein [Planctomycetota bacterium]
MPAPVPWQERAFGEHYLAVYPHRSLAQARREVAAIIPLLSLAPGARVADICCGWGRHAVALARRGMRVVGVDLSPDLLRLAPAARPAPAPDRPAAVARRRAHPPPPPALLRA